MERMSKVDKRTTAHKLPATTVRASQPDEVISMRTTANFCGITCIVQIYEMSITLKSHYLWLRLHYRRSGIKNQIQ